MRTPRWQRVGSLQSLKGGLAECQFPSPQLGEACHLEDQFGTRHEGAVVGFRNSLALVALFGRGENLTPGTRVTAYGRPPCLVIPEDPAGALLDPSGSILANEGSPPSKLRHLVFRRPPPAPLERTPFRRQFSTGIRSIDTLTPLAEGQRLGIIAPPGAGKTTLLGLLAQSCSADRIVVGLVGERGREVPEFLEHTLNPAARRRTTVVVATSDEPPLRRLYAAFAATSIAEYYRDQGARVLLVIDSLTRCARALREIGLAAGEAPVRHGYPSSVFTELPLLVERSGATNRGAITALYSSLASRTHEPDPLNDEISSLLDGHLVLRPEIANEGIRPAIDPLSSLSRSTGQIHSSNDRKLVQRFLYALHRLRNDRDVVRFGGTPDPELSRFLKHEGELRAFLSYDGPTSPSASWGALAALDERLYGTTEPENTLPNERQCFTNKA